MEQAQPNRVERMVQDLVSYVNLRIDAMKLNMVENLSLVFSNMMAVFIVALLGVMALLLFTAALVWWLGALLGSLLASTLIVGGVYLIAAVVVFALRDRLITDRMVRMFSQMFFNSKNRYDDENRQ